MNRQTAEFWTWRLMAGVAAALPVSRVIETHAGGGLYDTIELLMRETDSSNLATRLACNRPGRVHLLSGHQDDVRDLLLDLSHGLPIDDAVKWVVKRQGRTKAPDAVLATSLALMSQVLNVAMGEEASEW